MGTLGNLGAIDAEAGVTTRRAISELDRKLRLMNETFGRVVKNTSIVTTTAVVQYITVESMTGPQSTIKFDPTSYMTTTVDRDGNVTFQAYNEVGTPSFIFANPISFVGSGGLGDISSDTGTTPWKFTSNRGDAFAPATSGFLFKTSQAAASISNVHSKWTNASNIELMRLDTGGTTPGLTVNGNIYLSNDISNTGGGGSKVGMSAGELWAFWGSSPKSRTDHINDVSGLGGTWSAQTGTYRQEVFWNASPNPESTPTQHLQAFITLIKQLQSMGILG